MAVCPSLLSAPLSWSALCFYPSFCSSVCLATLSDVSTLQSIILCVVHSHFVQVLAWFLAGQYWFLHLLWYFEFCTIIWLRAIVPWQHYCSTGHNNTTFGPILNLTTIDFGQADSIVACPVVLQILTVLWHILIVGQLLVTPSFAWYLLPVSLEGLS